MTDAALPVDAGPVTSPDPVHWRITRNGSVATVCADKVGTEYELRIRLGNQQIWSQRYAPGLDQRLHQDADMKLREFLSFGWVVVPDAAGR